MKLNMPAGLENSEMNEKLSPTIGQPKLPGILSIAFGEPHIRINKAENTKSNTSATSIIDITNSARNSQTEEVDLSKCSRVGSVSYNYIH